MLYGDSGNDSLMGGTGQDHISAGDGEDTVSGGDDNDTIDGGEGNDLLHGDAGNDSITDTNDSNTIYGDAGNDTLAGTGILYGDDTNPAQDAGNDSAVRHRQRRYADRPRRQRHGAFGQGSLEGDAGNDVLGTSGYIAPSGQRHPGRRRRQ